MSTPPSLGWRVLEDEWKAFKRFVEGKWGSLDRYLRFELESAMREWLDKDGTLCDVEGLLREYCDARALSSSSNTAAGISLEGETKKLGHRVNQDLKEEFASHAKKHYSGSIGTVLSRALNAYRGGGREQRVKDLVHHIVTDGIAGDTTDSSDESSSEIREERDTTGWSDESISRSNESRRDTNSGSDERSDGSDESGKVDAMIVSDIASELDDGFLEDDLHKKIAMRAGGAPETIELYTEAVTAYKNAVEHPVRDGLYISKEQRETFTVYEDLDRDERVENLREMLVAEVLKERDKHLGITYTDVQELFGKHLHGEPSHDYAYTLMREAAEERGFKFDDENNPYRLEVTVTEVKEKHLENVDESEEYDDIDSTLVDALIDSFEIEDSEIEAELEDETEDGSVDSTVTQWSAGSPPSQQEAGADD